MNMTLDEYNVLIGKGKEQPTKNKDRQNAGALAKDLGHQWELSIRNDAYALYLLNAGMIFRVGPQTDVVFEPKLGRNIRIQRRSDGTPEFTAVEDDICDFLGHIKLVPIMFDAKHVLSGSKFSVPTNKRGQLQKLLEFKKSGGAAGYWTWFVSENKKVWLDAELFGGKYTVDASQGVIATQLLEIPL